MLVCYVMSEYCTMSAEVYSEMSLSGWVAMCLFSLLLGRACVCVCACVLLGVGGERSASGVDGRRQLRVSSLWVFTAADRMAWQMRWVWVCVCVCVCGSELVLTSWLPHMHWLILLSTFVCHRLTVSQSVVVAASHQRRTVCVVFWDKLTLLWNSVYNRTRVWLLLHCVLMHAAALLHCKAMKKCWRKVS